jgi:hypothetical protein
MLSCEELDRMLCINLITPHRSLIRANVKSIQYERDALKETLAEVEKDRDYYKSQSLKFCNELYFLKQQMQEISNIASKESND